MIKKPFIVIFGLPGTGKTTLALALSDKLNAVHTNTDLIRHQLERRGQYDRESRAAIYQELLNRLTEWLAEEKCIVVDGTFYRQLYRQQINDVARTFNRHVCWVEVVCAADIVKKRLSRSRPYSEADYAVHLKHLTLFEPLEAPHLVLDAGESTVAEMVERTVKYYRHDNQ